MLRPERSPLGEHIVLAIICTLCLILGVLIVL